jgi:hypothetical protein
VERAFVPWIVSALLAASGCDLLVKPRSEADAAAPASRPPAALLERAVRTLLPGLRFGADERAQAYREIRAVRVAGAHFVPAANRHVVHYCVDYTSFVGDVVQTRCDLNVQVYRLDSGAWVGHATGAGTIYRWQVLETAPSADPRGGHSEPREDGPSAP